MKEQRVNAWWLTTRGLVVRIWFPPQWSAFNSVSNSMAVRSTVLIPLIGYLIIFNEYVVRYLGIVSELAGSKSANLLVVSPRLLLVYFGLCAIAVGVSLYSWFCPKGVRYYGSPNAYVGGVQASVKRLALSEFEVALENSEEYRPYHQDIYERFHRSIETAPTSEDWAEYINGLLHLYYRQQNSTKPVVRLIIFILYAIGFSCLAIPSLGVFYRVSRMLWRVALTQFSLLF